MAACRPARSVALALASCLVALVLLAGCASESSVSLSHSVTPTSTPSATATNTATLIPPPNNDACTESTPTPPPPATTPPIIAPSGWATYTSTDYHYSIQYPANWPYDPAKPPTSMVFDVWNYDRSQVSGAGVLRPPLHKIEVDAFPNPSNLSAHDFYVANRQNDPLAMPACSQTTQSVTIAGRAAFEVVQHPVHWSDGVIEVVGISYFVPDGTNMLIVGENYSPNGQPSDIFAHMLASLTITG